MSIFDGERDWGVPESHLSLVKSALVDVPTTQTHALASRKEPPPLQHAFKGDWTWLSSLDGVDRGTQIELPVRQEAIPHIVGSKGKTIRALEENLVLLLGLWMFQTRVP